jgi:hypothetical protein
MSQAIISCSLCKSLMSWPPTHGLSPYIPLSVYFYKNRPCSFTQSPVVCALFQDLLTEFEYIMSDTMIWSSVYHISTTQPSEVLCMMWNFPTPSRANVASYDNKWYLYSNLIMICVQVLKETLIRHGFIFESDTDTEVIPKLAKFVFDKARDGEGSMLYILQ